MSEETKYVYFFGGGEADGRTGLKNLLGGKGANLAEMTNLGINVPPGFTITTEVCTLYYENDENYPEGLDEEVEENLDRLENLMGKELGDPDDPLLVSVRSGARESMPGMMDTVLNLGLNDVTVKGLAKQTGNERFAYDSYRRFVQMYGNVVLGMDGSDFEEIIEEKKEEYNAEVDTDLGVEALKELVEEFKAYIKKETGVDFPEDPKKQLWRAITAVFGSWNNERAISYRNLNDIPHHWGTAVNVQTMVYGNMGENCGTGVAFTRNPSTGEKKYYGEYLKNAQGEDVVSGVRTPKDITLEGSKRWAELADVSEEERASKFPSLEEAMPKAYKELDTIQQKLEDHYNDMQDLEFTIQDGRLWLLQTRTGKRTGTAMVK